MITDMIQKIDDKYLMILAEYYMSVRFVGYKITDINPKSTPLDDELRALLTLHYVQNDVSMADIACEFGLTELTVYAIINDVVDCLGLVFNADWY